jgi:hypothetical protein
MTRTVQVDSIKVAWALGRWRDFYSGDKNPTASFWFVFMRNEDYREVEYQLNRDGYLMSPEAAAKIEALCGPHWFAMLKAYEARK